MDAKATKKPTLDQIVERDFKGPVTLRAVRANKDMPDSRRLSFTEDVEDQIRDLLEIDDDRQVPIIFPVAALEAPIGKEYKFRLRARGNIIEAFPTDWKTLKEWRLDGIPAGFPLIFEKSNARWGAKHPRTGQLILAHKNVEFPDADHFVPQGFYVRPAMTRTFWIAGSKSDIAKVTPHDEQALVLSSGEPEMDWSYAQQWRIFGIWMTFAEVCGDPFSTTSEFDAFTVKTVLMEAGNDLERWYYNILFPAVHPDVLEPLNLPANILDRVLVQAEETRNSVRAMATWYNGWVAQFLPIYQRARVTKTAPSKPHLPDPIGRKTRPGEPLMTAANSKDAINRILMSEPKKKTAKRPTTSSKQDAQPGTAHPDINNVRKAAAATTNSEPATKPTAKTRGKAAAIRVKADKPPAAESHDFNGGNGNTVAENIDADTATRLAAFAKSIRAGNSYDLVDCTCGKRHQMPPGTKGPLAICPKASKK